MKTIVVTSAILLSAASIEAAEIFKADNLDALNQPSSWVGGVVPGADDVAVIYTPSNNKKTVSLGDDLTVKGLVITNKTVNIQKVEGKTLSIGSEGIYYSNEKVSMAVWADAKLLCDQRWRGEAGTISIRGTIDLDGHVLTIGHGKYGGSELNGSGNFQNGKVVVLGQKALSFKESAATPDMDYYINGGEIQINEKHSDSARARNLIFNGTNVGTGNFSLYQKETKGNLAEKISGSLSNEVGSAMTMQTPRADYYQKMTFGSLYIDKAAAVLFRGTGLGTSTAVEATPGTTGLFFETEPTLVGGIIPRALYAESGNNGTTFATYDSGHGVRGLDLETECVSSITSGSTGNDNVRLVNSTTGEQVVTSLDSGTTEINALMLDTPNSAKGNGGVRVTGPSDAKLKIKSGLVYARQIMSDVTAQDALTIDGLTIDLAGNAGAFISRQAKSDNGTSAAPFKLNAKIVNDGGKGITLSSFEGGLIYLDGDAQSEYSGPTRVVSGHLRMEKDVPNVALPSGTDFYLYGGSCQNIGNQIPDDSDIHVLGGTFYQRGQALNNGAGAHETFHDLFLSGGSLMSGCAGTSPGASTLNDASISGGEWNIASGHKVTMSHLSVSGGSLVVAKDHSDNYRTRLTVTGGVTIVNAAEGIFKPIVFTRSEGGTTKGAYMFLDGGLEFVGNATNMDRTEICNPDPVAEGATKACIYPMGAQMFNIGDGASDVDLYINLVIADNSADSNGGIVKTGAGTLMLSATNTYTLGTQVQAGRLIADGALAGDVTVAAGATFRGGDMGESGALAVGGNITFAQGAKLEFDPGAATTVAGDVVFGGVEMVLKDGAEITEDVLVMKARSFSGAVSGKFGKFVARYRNAGTELWLGKDKGFVITFR